MYNLDLSIGDTLYICDDEIRSVTPVKIEKLTRKLVYVFYRGFIRKFQTKSVMGGNKTYDYFQKYYIVTEKDLADLIQEDYDILDETKKSAARIVEALEYEVDRLKKEHDYKIDALRVELLRCEILRLINV